MGPEENLKCAFLLLNVYGPLESKVFSNVPHENYVEEASRCLEKLRKLDEIKKSLIKGDYPYVGHFVRAMEEFFTIPSVSAPRLLYHFPSIKSLCLHFLVLGNFRVSLII
ncbi:nuclear body protein SP140-like protein [Phyllostomus discolor]|uniref:Nuclear body protein SP140-like protein n=1 Tax=Phyllostomus discolor TaxID=89673 RepID=A0A7E6DQ29_9CHIR|nr:nuclear body protein SP140-like protein [Phyllostomus discolor]